MSKTISPAFLPGSGRPMNFYDVLKRQSVAIASQIQTGLRYAQAPLRELKKAGLRTLAVGWGDSSPK